MQSKTILWAVTAFLFSLVSCNTADNTTIQGKAFTVPGPAKVKWENNVFTISQTSANGDSKTTTATSIKISFTAATAAGGGIGIVILEDTSMAIEDSHRLLIAVAAAGFEMEKKEDGTIVITSGGTVVAVLDAATCTPIYLIVVVEDGVKKIKIMVPKDCIQIS